FIALNLGSSPRQGHLGVVYLPYAFSGPVSADSGSPRGQVCMFATAAKYAKIYYRKWPEFHSQYPVGGVDRTFANDCAERLTHKKSAQGKRLILMAFWLHG
ncbi:MAG: hypothetical protein KJ871_11490, partial [Alphaproteobacteria bacterium]|nr:hypothetical protein [Alphaproteobacteria bacterium]